MKVFWCWSRLRPFCQPTLKVCLRKASIIFASISLDLRSFFNCLFFFSMFPCMLSQTLSTLEKLCSHIIFLFDELLTRYFGTRLLSFCSYWSRIVFVDCLLQIKIREISIAPNLIVILWAHIFWKRACWKLRHSYSLFIYSRSL